MNCSNRVTSLRDQSRLPVVASSAKTVVSVAPYSRGPEIETPFGPSFGAFNACFQRSAPVRTSSA
jgi:hypothetical protein